jgi:cysteinyl-tRNA synthetase
VPIKDGEVSLYICGPTVYDDSHLGHARSAICFDLLHRTLKAIGYIVTVAKNFTDIDDKIIKKSNETGIAIEDITKEYIQNYKNDMKTLNILDISLEPKATEFVSHMITFIENLLNKKIAYKIDDGIYFDTAKDSRYGTLSNQKVESGNISRITPNMQKKSQSDFSLWKFFKNEKPSYEASFGDGRPGWHIECSVMIDEIFCNNNEKFAIDIHAGGADLLFPHHENEAAQTRCATNKEIAKYWMHNGFVNIDNTKMSKSLGNSFFLKDILSNFKGEEIRLYLISTHYRANFNFNKNDLMEAKKRLEKLYRLKKRVYDVYDKEIDEDFENRILEALKDDLNISIALSVLDDFISSSNEALDNKKKIKKRVVSNLVFIEDILGVGKMNAYEYFQSNVDQETKKKIEALIQKRVEAKKDRNFDLADSIKKELSKYNIRIMDTPNKTLWESL